MRNWLLKYKTGSTEVVRAWSARHALFVRKDTTNKPTSISLIGRANPDNPDGYTARVSL